MPPSRSAETTAILRGIDSLRETAGLGCVVVKDGRATMVRPPMPGGSTVVVEFRGSGAQQAPTMRRDAVSSPATEWIGLGFNCGGAVLAWIGVVGTAALTPATGGLSAAGTLALWGGALASTATCAASVYRVSNVVRHRDQANAALDQNRVYYWTMLGLDGVGLLGAGGAFKEIRTADRALEESRVGWSRAMGALNRSERLRLTRGLELQGARRATAATINAVLKQRLLDAIAGALGTVSSAQSGVLHDAVIWIVDSPSGGR